MKNATLRNPMMGIVATRLKRPSARNPEQKTSAITTSQKLTVLPMWIGSGNDRAYSAMWVIFPQPCAQKRSPAVPTRRTSRPIELVRLPPFDDIAIPPVGAGKPAAHTHPLRYRHFRADSKHRRRARGRGRPAAGIPTTSDPPPARPPGSEGGS